ncbi:MAG: LysR family transcriptional regulator [Proteobacteria bacterium]|nr:LysR family transcriptional regulator [Pseudomonadota bacterium]
MLSKRLLEHSEKLVIFEAVCRHGSIHGATNELKLTQPAITRSLQTLEKSLNLPLLTRGRHGVELTWAGELILKFSKSLNALSIQTMHEFEGLNDPKSATVTVGTFDSLAEYLWPKFIVEHRKLFPLFKINLRTSNGDRFQNRLRCSEIDFVVDAVPEEGEGVTSFKLYDDQFGLFHSVHRKAMVSDGFIVIVPSATDNRKTPLADLLKGKVDPQIMSRQIEVDSFATAAQFIAEDVGIGVLPLRLAAQYQKSKLITEFKFSKSSPLHFGLHSICATVLDRRLTEPKIKFFLSKLKAFHK